MSAVLPTAELHILLRLKTLIAMCGYHVLGLNLEDISYLFFSFYRYMTLPTSEPTQISQKDITNALNWSGKAWRAWFSSFGSTETSVEEIKLTIATLGNCTI